MRVFRGAIENYYLGDIENLPRGTLVLPGGTWVRLSVLQIHISGISSCVLTDRVTLAIPTIYHELRTMRATAVSRGLSESIIAGTAFAAQYLVLLSTISSPSVMGVFSPDILFWM